MQGRGEIGAVPTTSLRPWWAKMAHVLVFQVNFSKSDGCQILHGATTWYLLNSRIVRSSVGMLYGLFRIDLYAVNYVRAINVVIWQWEVDLLDSERCQTLHIAALWCLLNDRALTSTVRPRHGQFLPRYSFATKFGGKGLGTSEIGGLDVIRKEAWPFYRTISDVRLYWVLEEPKGPREVGAVPVSVQGARAAETCRKVLRRAPGAPARDTVRPAAHSPRAPRLPAHTPEFSKDPETRLGHRSAPSSPPASCCGGIVSALGPGGVGHGSRGARGALRA